MAKIVHRMWILRPTLIVSDYDSIIFEGSRILFFGSKMHVMQTCSEIFFWLYHTHSCSAHGADHEYHLPSLRKPSLAEKTSKYWQGKKKRLFCPFYENPRCFVSFHPRESSSVSFDSPFKTDLSKVIFKSLKLKMKVWRG